AGKAYLKKGNNVLAKEYFLRSVISNVEQNNLNSLADSYLSLANLYTKTNNRDSSIYYATKAFELFQTTGERLGLISAYNSLSSIYKLGNNLDSAFKYQGLVLTAKDSLN